MDIVLGVSMTPTSVRMVLVEGENADGLTVDHDAFTVGSEDRSATAPAQVVTAILGTRESAAEGGHNLAATGVTWRDHAEAAALRDALAAHNLDDVMLVSELHAAGALAQAVGRAVGYERTALMFLERDTATISVVQTADGSIIKVQTQDLHTDDAVAQLSAMVAGLEELDEAPQGVFVVGSGVSVAAIKLQLESATSLPVSAPEEAELALARGAALASANAPRFEATTVGLAPAADVTQLAGAGYMQPAGSLAYSEVDDADVPGLSGPVDVDDESAAQSTRRPFLLVGSAMTSIFVVGVAALVISLAVSIRPTVDERPTPGESMVVPPRPPAAASTPQPVAPDVPEPPAPIETIQAPKPVVQEAPAPQTPRTVFVDRAPAPAAPAPAPAAPAPPPAAPPPPPPAVVPPPIAPVVPPPVIVLPESIVPPILRPRWDPPRDYNPRYNPPKYDPPKYNPPKYDPPSRWEPPKWEPPKWEPPKYTPPSYEPPKQQWPTEPPKQQRPKWPGSDSGSRGGSNSGSDRGSSRGGDSIFPWPSFGD